MSDFNKVNSTRYRRTMLAVARLETEVHAHMPKLLRCRIGLGFVILVSASAVQPAVPTERPCNVHRSIIEAANIMYSLSRAIPEYRNAYGRFPRTLGQLAEPPTGDPTSADAAGIVHSKFLIAGNFGYELKYETTDAHWRIWATPTKSRKEGCGSFYLEDDGKIRVRWGEGEASPTDPLMQDRLQVRAEVMQRRLIVSFPPVYPRELRANWIQGDVQLKLLINQQGKVESVEVLSGNPALADGAVNSARKWVYQPVVLDGIPIEVETTVSVKFRLSR